MRRSHVLLAAVLVVLFAGSAAASSDPVVVFTVDVESKNALHLPAQIDATCTDGSACGLSEIARLLNERGWKGTFFLNVYEQPQWGEAAMRRIAASLHADGHDVALHTHPQWAYDSARPGMHEYSLEEQTAIVRDGVRLLQAWTGAPVVSHRAGAYAADERTLVALERNGVLLDSSVFWSHAGSKLDGLGLPRNFPGRHGQLTQIPVSVYERQDRPGPLPGLFAPVRVIRKIDPNWFVNAGEARSAIDALLEIRVPVLVVFLHSFSLMVEGPDGQVPVADRHARQMLQVILDHVVAKRLRVATMRDLVGVQVPAISASQDVVPAVPVSVDLPRYVWRRARASDPSLMIAATAAPLLLLGVATVALARRRQRRTGCVAEVRTSGAEGVQVQ